ncbi:MAG: GNAT family N-acetyltransferase [Chloroflexi bacterium]|nr:GNAT family N-acetyltransferase [Chloroflexota bacterium]
MTDPVHISDLLPDDIDGIEETARVLLAAFRDTTPSWPHLDAARDEVLESFEPGRISRVARSGVGAVVGWIGGISEYDGHVWEVHPLAVDPAHQRRGIGKALLADLEESVRQRGGLTLWLGTDDEVDRTSLGGPDLYPNLLGHLSAIRDLGGHPFAFYLRCGFALAGVVPDANGPGKPDILMAKRVAGTSGGGEPETLRGIPPSGV